MNDLYLLLTIIFGTILTACAATQFVGIYFCYDSLKDSIAKDALGTGMILISGQVALSVIAGWFAMVVFYNVETYLKPPPTLPKLRKLDRESGGPAGSVYSHDSGDAEKTLFKDLEDPRGDVTTKLIAEMRKCVLTRDRMALCEKMHSQLPKDTYMTKKEVDKILRYFINPVDGQRIVTMFEPFMENEEFVKPPVGKSKSPRKKRDAKKKRYF